VTLFSKQELFFWLVGCVAAIELFAYANAFKLTAATFLLRLRFVLYLRFLTLAQLQEANYP
jgi:hypothetical protein